MAKFRERIKILKFETKNVFFSCFEQVSWKAIVIFEISALRFVSSLVQK